MKTAAIAIVIASLAAGQAQAHPSKPFGTDARLTRIVQRAEVIAADSKAAARPAAEIRRVSTNWSPCRVSSHKTPATLVALKARACAKAQGLPANLAVR